MTEFQNVRISKPMTCEDVKTTLDYVYGPTAKNEYIATSLGVCIRTVQKWMHIPGAINLNQSALLTLAMEHKKAFEFLMIEKKESVRLQKALENQKTEYIENMVKAQSEIAVLKSQIAEE